MLYSSDELLKRYMWRYVDMNLNSLEIDYLKRIMLQSIKGGEWEELEALRFVQRREHLLQNGADDTHNLSCVLLQLSHEEFRSLARFFAINAKRIGYDVGDGRIDTYADLEACVGDERDLFALFVISVYYYF